MTGWVTPGSRGSGSPPHHTGPTAAVLDRARAPGWERSPDARHQALTLAALAVLVVAAILCAVRVGAVSLSIGEIVRAALGAGDPTTRTIVRTLRGPRAVEAALVGAALATSGATFQALLRNPLAEPYVLGVSSGAAVGAVIAVVAGLGAHTIWAIPLAAFLGAVGTIGLVLRLALAAGGAVDTRLLLLSGVVVSAFLNAAMLLVLTWADVESFRSALFWMMGSTSRASWTGTAVLAATLLPAVALLLALGRALDLLAVGEHTAATLGLSVERTKLLAYAIASLLAASAVAVSGVIGFVGLIIPHAVRLRWGSAHRFLIPAAALTGAAFLTITDTLARAALRPAEIPIGVVTAFVGVPVFVWLLKRRGAAARLV
jgi:iron complex transport system permease protein